MSQESTPILSNTDNHRERCPICGKAPICGGLGMVRYDVPVGDPRFGKLFRCPNNPPEQDQDWHHKLREVSNLSSLSDKRFDNFLTDTEIHTKPQQQTLLMALNTSRNFAVRMSGWLLLQGTYGCGKTHLAAAVGNYRLDRGDAVLFITVPDLLDHLRSSYGPSSEIGYDETFERIRRAPLLILDDLGVENPSPWAQEKLFQLLNDRYVHQMPTVITTNMEVERLDPRISSRLTDVAFVHRVEIDAPDFRNLSRTSDAQLESHLSMYADKTFATFETQRFALPAERANLERIVAIAESYAMNPAGWLLFTGPAGSGKTHLAAAIGNYWQQSNDKVTFLTAADLLDWLRTAFHPSSHIGFSQRFHAVRDTPALILDDLNMETSSPWAKEKLFQLLDYRHVKKLPTVITTLKQIEELDERLRSRLLDDRVCRLAAITVQTSFTMRRRRR